MSMIQLPFMPWKIGQRNGVRNLGIFFTEIQKARKYHAIKLPMVTNHEFRNTFFD